MKISEVVSLLQEQIRNHGDLECQVCCGEGEDGEMLYSPVDKIVVGRTYSASNDWKQYLEIVPYFFVRR